MVLKKPRRFDKAVAVRCLYCEDMYSTCSRTWLHFVIDDHEYDSVDPTAEELVKHLANDKSAYTRVLEF